MLETPSILRYTDLMTQCDNPLGAGNQQERSILSPDFLAGLIVGEGSYWIGIRRQKKTYGYYVSVYPGFSMRMNDVETIERVIEAFQAYGLDVYRNTAVYNECVSVNVIGLRQMRKHLDFFIPLLSGKKQQAAQIVSEFTDSRLANIRQRYLDSDVDLIEKLREVNGPTRARLPIEILRDYTLRADSSYPATTKGPDCRALESVKI
jgi:hypothetical protein